MTTRSNPITREANILPTDIGSRVGIMYLINGDTADMHFVFNGEDQGIYARKIPFKDGPLHAVVDIYGTTKQLRVVQHGISSLQMAARDSIRAHLKSSSDVDNLPLPDKLRNYLR
jgi:neuralized-like protein 2